MHMRVHHETDGTVGNFLDGRHDLVRQRRELGVYHENPVRTRQHADNTARSIERVEIVGDLSALDLDLAVVLLRLPLTNRRNGVRGYDGQCRTRKSTRYCSHGLSLLRLPASRFASY